MSITEKKIGVLMGGLSSEREVSLRTGAAVLKALQGRGYRAAGIDVNADVAVPLRAEGIEVVFIALHGRYGEDGAIQGLLEMMQIPYTGSGVLASALGMDKIASRRMFLHYKLPVPSFVVARREDPNPVVAEALPFDLPCVVKPSKEGSSIGVSLVEEKVALPPALQEAFRYGPEALIERYIRGRELHVAVLQNRALGVMEVRPKGPFYDYQSKYLPGMSEHLFPAPLPESDYALIQEIGLKAHRALGCRGYSRVDLMMDQAGAPYILEVNTLPGLTETSLLPDMARHLGISFEDLVERILMTAFDEDGGPCNG